MFKKAILFMLVSLISLVSVGYGQGVRVDILQPDDNSFLQINGGVVINDLGVDVDFRVEGLNDESVIFVEGSSDAVIIGGNALKFSQNNFEIQSSVGTFGIWRDAVNDDDASTIQFFRVQSSGVVTDNARLGSIFWRGNDGGDISTIGAAIVAEVDETFVTTTTNTIPTELSFFTAKGGTNAVAKWSIKPSGTFEQQSVNLTLASTEDYYGLQVQPGTITEFISGEHTNIAAARFDGFTVTDGAGSETVINLSTVYILNAPTAGSTPTNGPYSIFVDAGDVRFDGNQFSATTGGYLLVGSTAASATVPVFAFDDDSNTGIGSIGEGEISVIGDGLEIARFFEVSGRTGMQLNGNTLSSGGTNNNILSITVILNDAGAPGGSDLFNAIKVNITETDVTGWNTVNLMDLQVGATSQFLVSDAGTLTLNGDITFTGAQSITTTTGTLSLIATVGTGDDIILAVDDNIQFDSDNTGGIIATTNFGSLTADEAFTISTSTGDLTLNSAGQIKLEDQVVQQTNIIRAVIVKESLPDNTVTNVFTITTTTGEKGSYYVVIRSLVENTETDAGTDDVSSLFNVSEFHRSQNEADNGTSIAMIEVRESITAKTNVSEVDIGAVTVDRSITSQLKNTIRIIVDGTGSATPELSVTMMIELIYHGFSTPPVIAVSP